MSETSLRKLATELGITATIPAGPEAELYLVSLLQAAHLPITQATEADFLLQQLEQERRRRLVEPVRVIDEASMPVELPVRLLPTDERTYYWTLTEENGTRHQGRFTGGQQLKPTADDSANQYDPGFSLALDVSVALGYHEIAIHEGNEQEAVAVQLLIVAPREGYVSPGIADDQRVWGMSVQPHAIRSSDNWGIGDFSDLRKMLDGSADAGAGILHAGPLASRVENLVVPLDVEAGKSGCNPFSPSSRAHLNVLLIDVAAIVDFAECDAVNTVVEQTEFQARLTRLRDRKQLDYAEIHALKEEQLRKLWDCFYANHLHPETGRGTEFRRFQESGGETLFLFAVFSALEKKFVEEDRERREWPSYAREYADGNAPHFRNFVEEAAYEIEYHQYVQWQAKLQLAAIGRRSMELGLKVGLLGEFPFGVHERGFEAWRYQDALLAGAAAAEHPLASPGRDPAVGLPVFLPLILQKNRYRPLIEGLRQSMRYAGALLIDSIANYFQTHFTFGKDDELRDTFISWPFADILGIIALESRRNRCLVIADQSCLLPAAELQLLLQKKIFISHDFLQAGNDRQEWLSTAQYQAECAVRSSPPLVTSVQGFWQSADIGLLAAEHLFADETAKELAIVARAADRVQLLITLDHEHLLPEGWSVDRVSAVAMDHHLLAAIQIFLARTKSRILLVPIGDLLGIEQQAEPPGFTCQVFWQTAYPANLEELFHSEKLGAVYKALCRERGYGNIRPSTLISDRMTLARPRLPRAFYRLQLHKDFTFQQAASILPYLSKIGISHCYLSPFLTARPGSTHGYDIIDHTTINPEIGSRQDFESFLAVLEQQGMALVLDIVPNHMGIGSDNQWWMDVLENGQASKYAQFFDINWRPQQADLFGRLILPVLGDQYGKVLENGQLILQFDDISGTFYLQYFEHRFPVSPRSCPLLLSYDIERLGHRIGEENHSYQEFLQLIQIFGNLSGHTKTSAEMMQIRHRNKEVGKRTLARLCRKNAEIKQFIAENVLLFNGVAGQPESFDLLHQLQEEQPYRLAYWRVAADEINYRRFFDINDLAGLRMEEEEVFQRTHGLILDLVATGRLDGLRIDHPDGLYDPLAYFCRLQDFAAGVVDNRPGTNLRDEADRDGKPLYIVVEKILADFESLPENWPISGTTGYDFSHHLNGIFVKSDAETAMTLGYHRYIGKRTSYEELMYSCKKMIIRFSMAGELNVLTSLLYRLARANRTTRDFTFNILREALIEVICFFPVYRTYISEDNIITAQDIQFIEWALAKAEARYPLDDANVFDFIRSVLLFKTGEQETEKQDYLDFVRKFQQYTGPVMAKGVEDTFFYRYNRLLSLNEVGGNPKAFGTSVAAFHQTNQNRLQHWPQAMLDTSTHDSKRSEDVRARINVLTEMAEAWQRRIRLWSVQNRSHKSKMDGNPAPSKNDEYGFYQNLLGAWPGDFLDDQSRGNFVERMRENLLKTSRESKVITSWTNSNPEYEQGLIRFVERILQPSNGPFLHDFIAFHEDISWFGMLNSLSQVFLKLVSPGIPDIYQGNEVWRFCLVDPDNRRPVDFSRRQAMLSELVEQEGTTEAQQRNLQQNLLASLTDGRAKMYIIVKTLQLRKNLPEIFTKGSYLPLQVTGEKSNHICAFAREMDGQLLVAVAPRLYFTLMQGKRVLPLGKTIWQDTTIHLPEDYLGVQLRNVVGDDAGPVTQGRQTEKASPSLPVGRLLQSWPVALLQGERRPLSRGPVR